MDEITITLTNEERDHVSELVYDHVREIERGEITYGNKSDNEYMINMYQNFLGKIS